MVIGTPPQTEQFYLKGDSARKRLRNLLWEGFCDTMSPQGGKIDDIVEEAKLHQFDPNLVADVAMEYGLTIAQCCMCSNIRANGVWLPDSSKVVGYKRLSHTFCDPCDDKFREQSGLPTKAEAEACYHH